MLTAMVYSGTQSEPCLCENLKTLTPSSAIVTRKIMRKGNKVWKIIWTVACFLALLEVALKFQEDFQDKKKFQNIFRE